MHTKILLHVHHVFGVPPSIHQDYWGTPSVNTKYVGVSTCVHQLQWCAQEAYTKMYSRSSSLHTKSRKMLVCNDKHTKTQAFLVCILVCCKVIQGKLIQRYKGIYSRRKQKRNDQENINRYDGNKK
jgi:hypothetical protein